MTAALTDRAARRRSAQRGRGQAGGFERWGVLRGRSAESSVTPPGRCRDCRAPAIWSGRHADRQPRATSPRVPRGPGRRRPHLLRGHPPDQGPALRHGNPGRRVPGAACARCTRTTRATGSNGWPGWSPRWGGGGWSATPACRAFPTRGALVVALAAVGQPVSVRAWTVGRGGRPRGQRARRPIASVRGVPAPTGTRAPGADRRGDRPSQRTRWSSRRPAGWWRRCRTWPRWTAVAPSPWSREFTKVYEEIWRGSVAEAASVFGDTGFVARWCWWSGVRRRRIPPASLTSKRRCVGVSRLRRRAAASGGGPDGGTGVARRTIYRRGAATPSGGGRCRPADRSGSLEGAGTLRAVPPYYLTTPIYYVNDAPHLGHGVHHGERGRPGPLAPVGAATSLLPHRDRRARRENRPGRRGARDLARRSGWTRPRPLHRSLGGLDISNDDFIRTTEPRH